MIVSDLLAMQRSWPI